MAEAKIHIVGVGGDGLAGLTTYGRQLLQDANLVLASENTLSLLPDLAAEKQAIGADLQEVVRLLEGHLQDQSPRRIIIAASGDPLFFGVARYLCDRLGKEHFEVLPHVSSMQLAFARVKESWEDAYLTNLQSHSLESVLDRIRVADTVGLFTSEAHNPGHVAHELLARGLDYFRAFVCENLGGPDERVTQAELSDIIDMEFAPLNVMILKRKPGRPDLPRTAGRFRRFGNPDDVFAQSRPKSGLITQAEVRAMALAQLDLHPGDIVWDVGAGSGSVAVEAAQLAEPGMVYAIEQDSVDYHLILANADAFGVRNLKAIHGVAPTVFADLPSPDAVFVGGTGRESVRLLEDAYTALRPGGRLVANVATLETLNATYTALRALAGAVQVLLVSIARSTDQLETVRFDAVNPTFLLHARKPAPETTG